MEKRAKRQNLQRMLFRITVEHGTKSTLMFCYRLYKLILSSESPRSLRSNVTSNWMLGRYFAFPGSQISSMYQVILVSVYRYFVFGAKDLSFRFTSM
jgi:hypothetical protein